MSRQHNPIVWLAITYMFAYRNPMSTATPIRKLLSVQALRGIAALLVVLVHTAGAQKDGLGAGRIAEMTLLTGFWDQGYAGVDLFFVISGFIMVYVTQNAVPSLKNSGRFLFARASRIYPLWWVYLGLMMIYFFITYGQVSQPNTGTETGEIIAQTLHSITLTPYDHLPILIIGWTLVHEMMFYLVFAIVLLFPRKFLPWVMMVWAVLIGIRFYMMGAPLHAPDYMALIFSPLSLEFIMGAWVAWIILRVKSIGNNPLAWLAVIIGTVALSAALVIGIDLTQPGLTGKRVIAFGLPFAVLLYGVVVLERSGKLKTPTWLARLGDWSYSLYLSHLLVIMTLQRIFQIISPYLPEPLRFQAEGVWDNLLFTFVAIAASVIFSAISYYLIEQPLLRGTRKLWPRKA